MSTSIVIAINTISLAIILGGNILIFKTRRNITKGIREIKAEGARIDAQLAEMGERIGQRLEMTLVCRQCGAAGQLRRVPSFDRTDDGGDRDAP